jgi:hypothetical protein
MISMLLMTVALAGGDPCAGDAEDLAAVSTELAEMWKADHAERDTGSADLEKNDATRIKTARKLMSKGEVCTPQDHYHASLLLFRSNKADDLSLAYNAAKEAMMHHVPSSPYVVAITFDKWRIARGLTQRYGTQLSTKNGKYCIYEVMTEATNEERAQFGLDPIEKQYTAVLANSGFESDEPNAAAIHRRDLHCVLEAW